MSFLYRFEAKSIQRFVLGGTKLREMVGASALVEIVSKHLLYAVLRELGDSGEIVYEAAGAATLRFPEEADVKRFASRWPMEVAGVAPTLPIVQAWVPEQDGPEPLRRLAERLAATRNFMKPSFPAATPVLHRSPYGGLATVTKNDDRQYVDEPTARKIAAAKAKPYQELLRERFGGDDLADVEFPTDLEMLAGRGEGQYLAIVHADGNNIGSLVRAIASIEDLRDFSRALSKATEDAVAKACADALIDDSGAQTRRAAGRPVVVGGDDVTAIIRADSALRFVEAFSRHFTDCTRRADAISKHTNGRGLTASAGVAFVRSHHPFRDAYGLAEGLCGAAKAACRAGKSGEKPEESLPLVAFHRVTASLAESSNDIFQARELPGGQYVQTMGPYLMGPEPTEDFNTLDQLRTLSAALRQHARGKTRDLIRVMQEDPNQATEDFKRLAQVAGARNSDTWRATVRALTQFGDEFSTQPFSIERAQKRRTPIRDAHVLSLVEPHPQPKETE